jgi:hypothetical protein
LLTLLIASIRYVLTKKSAKNIHPENGRVLLWSAGLFFAFVICTATFFITNFVYDFPFSKFIDTCANQEPREYSGLTMTFLQLPNFFSFFAVLVDIQMLRFLKKTILPTSNNQQQNVSTRAEGTFSDFTVLTNMLQQYRKQKRRVQVSACHLMYSFFSGLFQSYRHFS